MSPSMRLLHRWWSHPADYAWTAAYQRSNPLLRHAPLALATWCLLQALLCVLATHPTAAAPDGVGQYLSVGLAVAGFLVGVLWVRGPWPTENLSRLFVVYLEIGGALSLLTHADPFVALPFATALAVNGSYIAAFHGPKMIVGHQAWAAAIVGVLFVHAVNEPGANVVLACAYLVLLTLVLFSAPMLTHIFLLLLRRDAATAFFDPLTGLRNRRGLEAAITEQDRRSGTVTVLVVDLDDFKSVNDRYGHAHGDLVLRHTATAIDECFVSPAITARTGGEEFAVVTLADSEAAMAQARALRLRFAAQSGVGATLSIGVAQADAAGLAETLVHLVGRADHAMYAAKDAGGNRIYIDGAGSFIADRRRSGRHWRPQ
ncbi:GGDEF domain-containing protein [Rhodococcus sp. H29-C3]|uniref:GGDEF domain-containing protein n=1 Tax=Rhodococcus sp. H29-C3 TaxID=3046307 RepID=UPI0024B8A9C7|nr:GGDEF domain-containing protein [Rhodococcus sp. H29-C3]MDJ0362296.1 GGDEF domain-containing protein [Rhodococcus sp. H29-C3]